MGSIDNTVLAKEEPIPLLTPFKLGPFQLSHRIVMAPLTRCRSPKNIPQPHAAIYYSQRATQGGLQITEATVVGPTGHGFPITPGIYTDEMVEAWKPIVKAVHDKGGIFFLQLWHVGRQSHESYQPNNAKPVSGSSKRLRGGKLPLEDGTEGDYPVPHQLTKEELPKHIQEFRIGARNALKAGFDGVEIHGGNGYLLEDFMKDSVNDRTDEYGPQSLENRARFVLKIVDEVVAEVGADRVGIRFSPFSSYGDAATSDPLPLGIHMVEQLNKRNILYVHFIEPRIDGHHDVDRKDCATPIRHAFKGPYLAAGGFSRTSGNTAIADGSADLVVFGRLFLANPDLPKRFALNAPLNKYDRKTFYTHDPVVGYTDYPFLEQELAKA